MARNGSGSYSIINTFVSGNSITAAGHNQNWSDIATEMTNSVAKDGQTSMTGSLKASNGDASTPAVTFASDLNTGMYRIGADNLGLAVGGTKIVDIASTGASVVGTFGSSGALTVTAGGATITAGGLTITAGGETITAGGLTLSADTIVVPTGTAGAPTYSFASDSNTGIYRIGADNLGIAVAGAKEVDVSATAVTVSHALTVTSGFTVSAGAVSLPAGSVANAALASPGGIVMIKTQALSNASVCDFVNGVAGVVLDNTYDDYVLTFELKPATDDVSLYLRVGTGGTPTYPATGYYWGGTTTYNNTNAAVGSSSDVAIQMSSAASSGSAIGNATGEKIRGTIEFSNPEVADYAEFSISAQYSGSGNQCVAWRGGGRYNTAGAITAVRLLFNSGNIASGRATLYGRTKV